MIIVKVVGPPGMGLPTYQTPGAAAMDLCSVESVVIAPGRWKLVGTGLHLEIPQGYEGQVRSRSGLAAKHGIMVLNSPGTIDADYRGEVKVILMNFGEEDFSIKPGDRVAQLVITTHAVVTWDRAETLSDTTRGQGGFGSTGK